jgi:hypothetical protein
MPTPRRQASDSGLPPVPVAIFLPHPTRPGSAGLAIDRSWCGITAPDLAALIAWYTLPREAVADLDAHPLIAQAASYLDRRPVTLATDPSPTRTGRGRPLVARGSLGLLFARLPRGGSDGADLQAMTNAMHVWRSMLHPGGYLVAALTAPPGRPDQLSHRATVITAARTAGLSWRQEFLAVLQPLPEFEPRAMPAAGTTRPALSDGRHGVNHHKVLAFRRPTGGPDA